MATFTKVNPGDPIQAHQLNQVIDALVGTSAGTAVPIAVTAVNDPTNYALTVQNDESGNSRALNVLKSDGSTLIRADASGVTLGSPLTLPTGCVTSAAIADGAIVPVDINQTVSFDVATTIRSRAAVAPVGGAGIEMYYDGANGVIQAYDRGASAGKPLILGGTPGVSVTTSLVVNGGTVLFGSTNDMYITRSGNDFIYRCPSAGHYFQKLDGTGGVVYGLSHYAQPGGTLGWTTNSTAYTAFVNWGANGSLTEAQNSFIVFRRNFDNIAVVTMYGTGETVFQNNAAAGTVVGSGCLVTNKGNYYGQIYYSTTNQFVVWPSAPSFKASVTPITGALAAVQAIDAVEYHLRTPQFAYGEDPSLGPTSVTPAETPEPKRSFGFLVDDWANYFPEVMVPGPGDVNGMSMSDVVPIMWQAVKELEARVAALEAVP